MAITNDTQLDEKHSAARTKRIPHARVSAEEYETIITRAQQAGLSPCDYVRRTCLGKRMVRVKDGASPALITELRAIGNNLSQLARASHIQHSRHDSELLQQSLETLGRALIPLLKRHYDS